jgi:hypothetical protein
VVEFVGMASDGTYSIDCGEEGAGAFNNFIIKNIQHRDIKETITPNLMSTEEIIQAEARARDLSKKVNKVLKDKMCHPTTTIVGAGSVFGCGIAALVDGKNPFSIEDLTTVVHGLTGKTDADFGGGNFAFCEGSNAILTLGFMQGLNIEQMHIINVNNTDGAIIYEPFWK